MFSLIKRKILKTTLGFKYRNSRRSKWWLSDESLIPLVQSVASYIERYDGLATDNNIEIVKREVNRLVFRVKSLSPAEESFIVKVFPLCCLRHRLKYHIMKYSHNRFAFGEAVNLLIGAKRGLNVPKVHGYGQVYGCSTLIKKSVLIIEDLEHHITIGELLKLNSADQEKCGEILNRAIPIFVSLYEACCNDISVNSGSIMFGDEGLKQDDFILDLEYARFYDKPSLELLMFEAATLAKYCKFLLTEKTINEWVDKLLDAVETRDRICRGKMVGYFNYYFNTQLSRKEREKIGAS